MNIFFEKFQSSYALKCTCAYKSEFNIQPLVLTVFINATKNSVKVIY